MLNAAGRYAELRESARVRDRLLLSVPRPISELELQARWFAGEFGKRFRTTSGDDLEVVQFGEWNRESGPDFTGAAVRINGGEAARGSVEVDMADTNWETHGHSANPAFEGTVLHVFVTASERRFFTRTSGHRNVPQVRINPAEVSAVDVRNVPLAHAGRCQAPLRNLTSDRVNSILEAAAQFRLRRKAQQLQQLAADHGESQALFQAVATALGYKQNKLPFTLLAQRVPLRVLRARGNSTDALLFGVAGLLTPDIAQFDQKTREYVRRLWDEWWAERDRMARLVLPERLWNFSGARPLNHPQRRIAALGALARSWPKFFNSLGAVGRDSADVLAEFHHPFWEHHYTVNSARSAKPMALIGESRIAEIEGNVILPYQLSRRLDVWPRYAALRATLTNRKIEIAATRLFGDNQKRGGILRMLAYQQGLLQIYEDFCMQDNSDCVRCPFPEQMQKWS